MSIPDKTLVRCLALGGTFMALVADGSVHAGWNCQQLIRSGSQTVGVFGDIVYNDRAVNAVGLIVFFIILLPLVWWLRYALAGARKWGKQGGMKKTLSTVNLLAAGLALLTAGYYYILNLVPSLDASLIHPTWLEQDAYGCINATYTLTGQGRVILAVISVGSLAIIGTTLWRQWTILHKKA